MKIKVIAILSLLISLYVSCEKDNLIHPENSSIFEGDITIRDQIEVIELGKKKYTKITGNLLFKRDFTDTTKIHDLSPLRTLEEVGSLIIILNDSLKNLDGLDNLKTINKELTIKFNSLNNIDGLSNLSYIGETLSISQSKITNLKALNNVSNPLKKTILIQGLDLTSIVGVPSISDEGSFLKVAHTKIEKLSSFEKLKGFKGTIEILNNDNLKNLNIFNNLETVHNLIIRDNNSLKNLDGLENMMNLNNKLEIIDNKILEDFCNLNSIFQEKNIQFEIRGNKYNPTKNDFNLGNCKIN